ncbi:unnamed protein product [Lymnaea stagnalis]|uniref:IgGFc-binding protein N-terminal domain-containing protein n=1 Tax=Lymnaea stagnalis TaxID=6523 RepID=A0AAV2I332_LYMST
MVKKGRTQVVGPATNDLPTVEKGSTIAYGLAGNDKFTVTVVMRTSADGTATYNALPVYAWGTIYYVITGTSMPFVLITTVEENTVTLWLSGSKGMPVEFKLEGVIYKPYDKLEQKLKMLETFVISKCSGDEAVDNLHSILDGAKVIAEKPVGVTSGNCRTVVNGIKCPEPLKRPDMMAEMMLPVDEYRRRMILPNIPNRKIPAEMVVVSPWPNTKFFVSSESEIERYVTSSGQVVKNPYHAGNFYIRGDKGILTLYTQTSTCRINYEEPMGAAPNLCIVIPTSLFYYRYFWRTPDLQTMDFILIVARKKDRKYLIWDDKPLNLTLGWEEVYGAPMYAVGNKKVVKGHHVLVSTRMYTFACYVYGFGRNNSYMHSAGFQECGLGPDSDTKDDLIDNDCDGQVDEEMKDNIDNDGDGFIDEDLNSKFIPSKHYYLLLFLGMIVVYIVLFIIVKKSGIIKRKKKTDTPPVEEEEEAKNEDAQLSESEMLKEVDPVAGSEVDSGSASGRGSDHLGNTAQSYVSRRAPSHVSRKAESTVASFMYSVAPDLYGTSVE